MICARGTRSQWPLDGATIVESVVGKAGKVIRPSRPVNVPKDCLSCVGGVRRDGLG